MSGRGQSGKQTQAPDRFSEYLPRPQPALSEQRRGAPEAQSLYEETKESVDKREKLSEQRKAQPKHWPSATKPNKKQRRLIQQFKQQN